MDHIWIVNSKSCTKWMGVVDMLPDVKRKIVI